MQTEEEKAVEEYRYNMGEQSASTSAGAAWDYRYTVGKQSTGAAVESSDLGGFGSFTLGGDEATAAREVRPRVTRYPVSISGIIISIW